MKTLITSLLIFIGCGSSTPSLETVKPAELLNAFTIQVRGCSPLGLSLAIDENGVNQGPESIDGAISLFYPPGDIVPTTRDGTPKCDIGEYLSFECHDITLTDPEFYLRFDIRNYGDTTAMGCSIQIISSDEGIDNIVFERTVSLKPGENAGFGFRPSSENVQIQTYQDSIIRE